MIVTRMIGFEGIPLLKKHVEVRTGWRAVLYMMLVHERLTQAMPIEFSHLHFLLLLL